MSEEESGDRKDDVAFWTAELLSKRFGPDAIDWPVVKALSTYCNQPDDWTRLHLHTKFPDEPISLSDLLESERKLRDFLPKEKVPDRIELNSPSLEMLKRGANVITQSNYTGIESICGVPVFLDESLPNGEVHFKEWSDEGGIRHLRTFKIFSMVISASRNAGLL